MKGQLYYKVGGGCSCEFHNNQLELQPFFVFTLFLHETMNGESRLLVTDEQVEFEK